MSECISFVIGTMVGGLTGVVLMCCLQIGRFSNRKGVTDA